MPRSAAAAADPLAKFLGFDPARDPDCVRLDEVIVPDPEPVAAPAVVTLPDEPPVLGDEGKLFGCTLGEALRLNPKAVVYLAVRAVFEGVKKDPRTGEFPQGGRYGHARLATCWALRELGHAFRREVMASGWIVGKRDNPNA